MNKTERIISISLSAVVISTAMLTYALPVSAGYGTSAGATVCNNSAPDKASIAFIRNSSSNQIEVGWNKVNNATSWTVSYGLESGKYIYGIANFGDNNSRSVKINMLPKGTYYVAIKANNECMPGAFSEERKIVINNGEVKDSIKQSNTKTINSKFTETTEVGESVSGKTPSVSPQATPVITNNSEKSIKDAPQLNFFQKLWKFLFG